MLVQFSSVFLQYLKDLLPLLMIGFLISGIIHEFVSAEWIGRHLGQRGIKPILYAVLTGVILPICCLGALPVAVSFYRKGARLGPILAFLVAEPATSVPAMLVTYKLLGMEFAVFLFFSVIFLGLITGFVGNLLFSKAEFPKTKEIEEICKECGLGQDNCPGHNNIASRIKSVFKFSFWEFPKEIGLHILVGLGLAALVATFVPLGNFVENYLSGNLGYIFAAVFGVIMYICDTASVPLVHALILQGMNQGAALTLLLVGPITSYSALLVLKKIFGWKVLSAYLTLVLAGSLLLGFVFSLII